MGIPANTAKVVISGKLGSTEIFQTGFWQAGITPPGVASAAGYAGAVEGIFASTALAALAAVIPATCAYKKITVYFYTGGATAAYSGEAPITGGTGTAAANNQPFQSAACVTLLTGLAGRQNRGRMYIPVISVPPSDGFWNQPEIGALSTAIAALFNGCNGGTSDEGSVSVVSNVGTTSHPVTSVHVDNKPDTQRRRANKLVPAILHSDAVTP